MSHHALFQMFPQTNNMVVDKTLLYFAWQSSMVSSLRCRQLSADARNDLAAYRTVHPWVAVLLLVFACELCSDLPSCLLWHPWSPGVCVHCHKKPIDLPGSVGGCSRLHSFYQLRVTIAAGRPPLRVLALPTACASYHVFSTFTFSSACCHCLLRVFPFVTSVLLFPALPAACVYLHAICAVGSSIACCECLPVFHAVGFSNAACGYERVLKAAGGLALMLLRSWAPHTHARRFSSHLSFICTHAGQQLLGS
eukprot:1153171-Pelagomonas_calceolata.AAC.2